MITIYGSSDDVIVVSGAINEEFTALSRDTGVDPGGLLAFSDGTVLRVTYTDEGEDGLWRITPVHVPDRELLTITQCPVSGPGYSDAADLRADVDWVVYGLEIAHNRL